VPKSPGSPPKHGFLRRHAGKLIASAIITVPLVYLLQSGGLVFVPREGSFDHVRWWTVPAYLVTLVVCYYYRAVRWRFLLRATVDVPRARILAVSWIGFAAILLIPFRLGEFVRPFMLRDPGVEKDGKVVGHVSMPMATGTIVAERVIDGLYLSIVLAVALAIVPMLVPLSTQVVKTSVTVAEVRGYGYFMLGGFALAFTVIAVFYFARAWAHKATLAVFGIVSKPLGEKLAGFAERLAGGLHLLGRGRDAWPFLLETTLYWESNAVGMWLLAWGYGVVHADGTALGFGEACSLMGVLGIAIMIPAPTPGMLGVFQAGLYAGMTMYFPKEIVTGAGAAFVFLLYAIQVGWQIVAAFGVLAFDRSSRHALEEAGEQEGEAEQAGQRGRELEGA
jgi:glycosyltransferase 2 family protein